jgi:hypothetical protein
VDSMLWQIIHIGCVLLLLLYIGVVLLLLLIYVGPTLERCCVFLQGYGKRTQEALNNSKKNIQINCRKQTVSIV